MDVQVYDTNHPSYAVDHGWWDSWDMPWDTSWDYPTFEDVYPNEEDM